MTGADTTTAALTSEPGSDAFAGAPVVAASRRGPGRPRRDDIDERVLSAVVALIDQEVPITVSRVVERSGVGRAAVYRRWSTIEQLTADALDVGRAMIDVPRDVPLRDALMHAYLGMTLGEEGSGYTELRLRQRLRLALADRRLQRAYWDAHVSSRRLPVAAAIRQAMLTGEVRSDADVEATMDLLSGVFYYQLVARGTSFADAETRARCAAALDIVWRGIASPTALEVADAA